MPAGHNRALRGREGACRDFTSPAARTSQLESGPPLKLGRYLATLHYAEKVRPQFLSLRHQTVAYSADYVFLRKKHLTALARWFTRKPSVLQSWCSPAIIWRCSFCTAQIQFLN